MLLFLASCGGEGDSGGGGTPTPSNSAPIFTSATTASVAENASGTVYTATATDADNNALSYAIGGGADGARFAITAAGALSFLTPPDFEAPTDANGDNIYEVTITVSDGTAKTNLALRITVTDATAGAFRVRQVTGALTQPVLATALPDGSGRMLAVERTGLIRIVTPSTGAVNGTPFLDVRSQIATDGERGLLGLALAPDYATSGRAYVYLIATNGDIELRRYTRLGSDPDRLDPASADRLLRIPHARNNHNGGWIGFGKDGLLYMGTGDGGGGGDPDGNGQNTFALLGKMLRLDVSGDDFPLDADRDYKIPAANPYVTNNGGAPEVWLYGLRNPFRNSFDRVTGNLWIGDVGQDAIEEVDLVRTAESGLNMGWPLYEGTQRFSGNDPTGITMPVTQYGHGSGLLQGNSITGGFVYRGPVESLQGQYIFADFVSNNIWSIPVGSLPQGATAPTNVFTNRNTAFAPNAGTLGSVTGFGEDVAGNLYIVSINGGMWVIEAAS